MKNSAAGILLWEYLGGPWSLLQRLAFARSRKILRANHTDRGTRTAAIFTGGKKPGMAARLIGTQGTAAMSLHVLEDIICRVHKLHPDSDGFLSECSSLGTLIIRGRIDEKLLPLMRGTKGLKPLWIDAVRELVEGLLIVEGLLAARIGRPASFANVVRMLRAPHKGQLKGASEIDKATVEHLQESITCLPIPEHLRPLLQRFAVCQADTVILLALTAVGKLLRAARAW